MISIDINFGITYPGRKYRELLTTNFSKFSTIENSSHDVLNKNLKVMDSTSISLAKESQIPIIITNLNNKHSMINAIRGINIGIPNLLLISIFKSENFSKGNIHTGLLDQEYKDGYNYSEPSNKLLKKIFIPIASYIFL